MDIILIGAQASGKGTQAELLTQILDIPHISSGDLFREEIDQHTMRGRNIQRYIDHGELVPDKFTVDWFCAVTTGRLPARCSYGWLPTNAYAGASLR